MALTLIGGAIGAPIGVASQVAGRIRGTGGDITRFATTFDIGIAIKYGLQIVALTAILIFALQFARGLFIAIEQIPCGISAYLSLSQGDESVCNPNNPDTVISSVNWAWDIEWYMLCFFYLGLIMVMGSILYVWIKKLLHILINIDNYIDLVQSWVFGEKKMFSDEYVT
jgi:hypothetical protein